MAMVEMQTTAALAESRRKMQARRWPSACSG